MKVAAAPTLSTLSSTSCLEITQVKRKQHELCAQRVYET